MTPNYFPLFELKATLNYTLHTSNFYNGLVPLIPKDIDYRDIYTVYKNHSFFLNQPTKIRPYDKPNELISFPQSRTWDLNETTHILYINSMFNYIRHNQITPQALYKKEALDLGYNLDDEFFHPTPVERA